MRVTWMDAERVVQEMARAYGAPDLSFSVSIPDLLDGYEVRAVFESPWVGKVRAVSMVAYQAVCADAAGALVRAMRECDGMINSHLGVL